MAVLFTQSNYTWLHINFFLDYASDLQAIFRGKIA